MGVRESGSRVSKFEALGLILENPVPVSFRLIMIAVMGFDDKLFRNLI